jgi:hypothetical protein
MDKVVEAIKERIKNKDTYYWNTVKQRASAYYSLNVAKGDWSSYVKEYEDILKLKIMKKKKEVQTMDFKKRVLIRLSKDYQVVEVEVEGMETENDYQLEKEWALQEARGLINSIGGTPPTPKKEYVNNYVKKENTEYKTGKVTEEDIKSATKFCGKGKQPSLLAQGVNNGLFTMDDIKAMDGWKDEPTGLQTLIKKVFASGKKY